MSECKNIFSHYFIFILWIVVTVFISSVNIAYAGEGSNIYIIIAGKQEAKKRVGWSLADWMQTKNQMKLMDQWLAMHSSANIFEFFASAEMGKYDLKLDNQLTQANPGSVPTLKQSFNKYEMSMFATIFGLSGMYETTNEKSSKITGKFLLRILGKAQQGTNLTLHYGIQKKKLENGSVTLNSVYSGSTLDGSTIDASGDDVQNQFFGASMSLYIFKFFGFNGEYSKYIKDKSSDGFDISGNEYSYGAFIDSSFIRLSGKFFKEEINKGSSKEVRDGYRAGLTFFF